jgi:hypothetical protein
LAGAAVAVASEAVAGSATAAAATEAARQKAKVAAVERRASARALTLARSRGSEAAEGLRSPELAMTELEISWASEEREELGDEEKEQKEEPEVEKEKEKEPADERRRSHRSRKRRSQKRRMSYFCLRSQRAGRSQKERWSSWRERRSWSPPCQS